MIFASSILTDFRLYIIRFQVKWRVWLSAKYGIVAKNNIDLNFYFKLF